MAEIQEEILWLCEAARIPVVWATQVLDDLVKEGLPSRAETTDAAMAQRAECVMLNKGPHVVEAIRFLSDIIGKMSRHQSKKYSLLGALHSCRSTRSRSSRARAPARRKRALRRRPSRRRALDPQSAAREFLDFVRRIIDKPVTARTAVDARRPREGQLSSCRALVL